MPDFVIDAGPERTRKRLSPLAMASCSRGRAVASIGFWIRTGVTVPRVTDRETQDAG